MVPEWGTAHEVYPDVAAEEVERLRRPARRRGRRLGGRPWRPLPGCGSCWDALRMGSGLGGQRS